MRRALSVGLLPLLLALLVTCRTGGRVETGPRPETAVSRAGPSIVVDTLPAPAQSEPAPTPTIEATPEPPPTPEPPTPEPGPTEPIPTVPRPIAPPSPVPVRVGDPCAQSAVVPPAVVCGDPVARQAQPTPAIDLGPGVPLRPIVVQIDNATPARPALNLSAADVVYEYVAEGGVTRFSALFTKEDPGVIGPVRSARLVSLEIARQFEALLVYHGASIGVQDIIWNGGIYFVSFNGPGTANLHSRLGNRPAPHNSVTSLRRVRDHATAQGVPPRVPSWPDFPRGDAPQGGMPAERIRVGFAGPGGAPWRDYEAEFCYAPAEDRYQRFTNGAAQVDGATGQHLSVETVVVQVAPIIVTNIVEDVYGSRSLDYQLQGEGPAFYYRGGLRWRGRWVRSEAFAPTSYLGPDGEPFPFAPGPIWIAIASPETPLQPADS